MTQLTTKQLYITPPAQPVPPPSALPVQFVKPLSYEFRVAEIIDDGKITKVKLQMQIWEHDEYGSGIVKTYWQDVPRIQMDTNGIILPTV